MNANNILSKIAGEGLSVLLCCRDGLFIGEVFNQDGRAMAEGEGITVDEAIIAMGMDYIREGLSFA